MTEAEAERAIQANGYKLRRRGAFVEASEPGRRAKTKTWSGVSCIDLVNAFGLHVRKANKAQMSSTERS